MRVSAQWVLVIGLFSAGLLGEDLERVSIRDAFRFGTLLQISIEKSAMFPERLCPGSAILYEVTLNNQSGQATGNLPASIEDPIPADTKYISGSVSENAFFDSANNRVVWTGTLGVGGGVPQSQSISFSVRVNQGVADGTVINNAASGRANPPGNDFLIQQIELPLTVSCLPTSGPVSWTGGGDDDDFSNPENWDPPLVPGPDHDAVIPADGGIITISQSHEIRSLDLGTNSTLRIECGSLLLREDSTIDGLLVNGSEEPSSETLDTQGAASGGLIIQGDVSGTGRITNLDQMSVSSASLDVELETDGNIEINGRVNLMRPSENRGSYSLDSGDSLHYRGSGHNLGMTLNGPSSGVSDAVVFLQQATTATVQIDSSASASVTGPVEVRGHLIVIISGAPPASSVSSTQTNSGLGSATRSGGSIHLRDESSLRNRGTMTLSEPGDGSPALTVQNGAEYTNAGRVNLGGGTILLEGNAQLVNEVSGELSGSGTIEGSVRNAGVFQVGDSIGGITVTGEYNQLATGELRMELAGASSFDVLRVGTAMDESASLDGALSVSLIDGFGPATGDSFLIVDGPTQGSFSNCIPSEMTCTGLPTLAPGLIWDVIQGSVRLSVTVPGADLELKKVVDKTSADVGETVTFTVTLENKGPETATNIQVRDPVPSGLTDIQSSGGYDQATGIWIVPSLARDTTAVLTLTGELSSSRTVTNTAEIIAVDQMDADSTPDNGDENEDDQASASVSVDRVADLGIT